MALSASCDALYFPAEPRDNVVTLCWTPQEAPLQPNTTVLYKVKCTAPQLFHVQPRYGGLVLADATGTATPAPSQTTTITFGLRGGGGGGADGEDDGAAAPSAVSRHTTRGASATPGGGGGGPAYQERFAVEYVVVQSEPLALQQIHGSLGDAARLTEVVKNMWSLIASGAIPRAHLGAQATLHLKVYTINVVLHPSDPAPGGDGAKIVVPPEARLVPPGSAADRHGGGGGRGDKGGQSPPAAPPPSSRQPGSDGADRQGSTASSAASRRKPADELRALRDEINTMRRESVAPGSSNGGGSARNTASPVAMTPSNKTRSSEVLAAAAPSSAVVSAGGKSSGDQVMRFAGAGADKQRAGGIKVYVVLAVMLALYVCLLWMRRGATHAGESGAVAAPSNAVQVSSRDVKLVSE
ncbi:hypothetical protein NESM_000576000 [Novymonas esmeraldas]|uniref:MSP domain-containing protein n=1 Tax=Novymonas esmeraldas TaxID=1808958 RepID=A0AAW0ET09_9TRYP